MTRIEIQPEKIERGLLKLVLAVVELLRQVMEKQAMRRVESGTLASDDVERLGICLMALEAKVKALQAEFEIDDLNINLGPLGELVNE